jgi:hypothetical protein
MTAMILTGPPRPAARVQPGDDVLVPGHLLPHRGPAQLLAMARHGLAEAERAPSDALRFAAAHLAALRTAAAVLAAWARPDPRRRSRVTSVWALLTSVAPELGEWAEFFAAGATKRAAAEAGIPRSVTAREADDLVRTSGEFLRLVAVSLNLDFTQLAERAVGSGSAARGTSGVKLAVGPRAEMLGG